MDFIYKLIRDILNANESMVIVTWDTLHIILTLLIFNALIIFLWLSRLDRYMENEWKYENISDDKEIRRCIDTDKSMFV